MLFHCNCGCKNMSECYVIPTGAVLFVLTLSNSLGKSDKFNLYSIFLCVFPQQIKEVSYVEQVLTQY